jgi:hypothetical protein
MPKTTSAPTASRERTRDWAPVAGVLLTVIAGLSWRWTLQGSVADLGNKKPLVPGGTEGRRVEGGSTR